MSAPIFDGIQNIPWENYVFIECKVCHAVYRFGIYGFRAGYVQCPICSCFDWNPKIVDKYAYIAYMKRLQTPYGMERRQKEAAIRIEPHDSTDED